MRNERRFAAANRTLDGLTVPQRVEDTFGEYRDDPRGFVRDVLGGVSATRRSDGTPYQAEVLQAVAEHDRVALVSGHGVGKSTILAWLVIWFLCTRRMSRVVLLAPVFGRQVVAVNFAEIRRWVRRARVPLPLEVQAGRVVVTGHGAEWGCVGIPATDEGRLEGFHGDHTLLLLDETKSVPQPVFDALQGMLSGYGDAKLVIASTPGGVQGPFWRTFQRGAEQGWHTFQLSAEDSSNVNPVWCERRALDWGRESALYQSRVLGRFASEGDGALFSLALVEGAMVPRAASGNVTPAPEVVLGIDVAHSVAGDQNCIAVAVGATLTGLHLFHSKDLMGTVQRCATIALLHKGARCRVDATGVGAGVADRLKQLGFAVEAVHFGGGATDPQRFKNLRAQMYWRLRERLEEGATLLDDEALLADLTSIQYEFDAAGRVTIEAKADLRRRLGRSPDRADAAALALGVPARRPGIVGPFIQSHFSI